MSVVELPSDILEPAFFSITDHFGTAGGEAADFAASCGIHLDAAQRFCLDVQYAETKAPHGWDWAAFEFALIATRQNLKTYTLLAGALADAFLFDQGCVWTAHRMRTTGKAFNLILGLVENYDHLRRRVKAVSRENGNEWIQLRTVPGRDEGALIEFMARTALGGRGFTSPNVIFDEALALTVPMMDSLMPVILATQNPQIRYASSAGLGESRILRDVRDRGRVGEHGLSYIEWADKQPPTCQRDDCSHARNTPGCSLDDRERWRRANVALTTGRITIAKLANLRKSMTPEGFARECLGWWDDPTGESAITPAVWAENLVDDSRIKGAEHFALEVAPSRSSASIAVAGVGSARHWHVEVTSRKRRNSDGVTERVLDNRTGTDWVVPRFVQLKKRFPDLVVHVRASSAAESLIPALEAAGIDVEVMSATKAAAACGFFYDTASARQLAHLGQATLTAAVQATGWREIAEKARVWTRRITRVDTTPMWAATVALYAAYEAETADYDVLDSVH
ncbi:hypothetical protein ACK8HX_02115 [Oryzobacter sp. R7]|uniref:hypothetical protein n=1 Tax=Oryzobacter faecalis TaxID=3388656 RepID=UPI00398D1C54